MAKLIRIYADEGASRFSIRQLALFFQALTPFKVHLINAQEIIEGSFQKDTALLAFGGGKDIPYHEKLQGKGCQNILNYVANGGTYMGICAGAYFGCCEVVFDQGGPLEVIGKRELAFHRGQAIGPIYKENRFSYEDESGVSAALIHTTDSSFHTYYNGGCYFEPQEGTHILARYENEKAAIIVEPVGKGSALLSGVHIEYNATHLKNRGINPSILNTLLASEQKRVSFILKTAVFRFIHTQATSKIGF